VTDYETGSEWDFWKLLLLHPVMIRMVDSGSAMSVAVVVAAAVVCLRLRFHVRVAASSHQRDSHLAYDRKDIRTIL
jgi:hypothetical protein